MRRLLQFRPEVTPLASQWASRCSKDVVMLSLTLCWEWESREGYIWDHKLFKAFVLRLKFLCFKSASSCQRVVDRKLPNLALIRDTTTLASTRSVPIFDLFILSYTCVPCGDAKQVSFSLHCVCIIARSAAMLSQYKDLCTFVNTHILWSICEAIE